MSGLLPPGATSRPAASRVLVLAPHYDDETFGCGGLLAELAAAGSEIRTLFLTDGGGDLHDPEERRAYSELRQQEARRALAALGLYRQFGPDAPGTTPVEAGTQQVPAFAFADLDGGMRRSAEWADRILVINFWATWCPPCRRELPVFAELQSAYGDRGVQFLALDLEKRFRFHPRRTLALDTFAEGLYFVQG